MIYIIFNKIFDANIKLLSGDTQNIRVYFLKIILFIFITTYIFFIFYVRNFYSHHLNIQIFASLFS